MAAADLLELALDGHGGLERWRAAREVRIRIRSGGLVFAAREPLRRRGHAGGTVHFSTDEARTVFYPSANPKFPAPVDDGQIGVYDKGSVWIESSSGEALVRRDQARAAFAGLRRQLWWDRLDAIYFRGYALWNYIAAPFMFTRSGFQLREGKPFKHRDEVWRTLEVTFPDDVPTHSREQTFYFNEQGILQRLDYVAEVVGSYAVSAHSVYDHETFDGIVVPTRRNVTPRVGQRAAPGPAMIWIRIDDFELVPRTPDVQADPEPRSQSL
jgi:hypothetical protein